MKIRKLSLSNNGIPAVGPDVEKETSIDTSSSLNNSSMNFCVASSVMCTESLTGIKDNAIAISDIPILCSVTKINSAERSNIKLDNSNDFSIEEDERTKGISQIENAEASSIPKELSKSNKVKQYRTGSIRLTKSHAVCCKILIGFAICCTTGCSLVPIIFYYASQIVNNVPTRPEYSHNRNTSTAKVC